MHRRIGAIPIPGRRCARARSRGCVGRLSLPAGGGKRIGEYQDRNITANDPYTVGI